MLISWGEEKDVWIEAYTSGVIRGSWLIGVEVYAARRSLF